MFANTIKVFVPHMNKQVTQQYVFNTFSKFNLGTIGEISMREKFTSHSYYTCMVEFLGPPNQAMYKFFNYVLDENATVKIKTKFGYWNVEPFRPKHTNPPEEEIIIDYKHPDVLTFDKMNFLPENTYFENY